MEPEIFNVDAYLNSLSVDTEEIDLSNKNLKYLPDMCRFTKLKKLDCSRNKLTRLPSLRPPIFTTARIARLLETNEITLEGDNFDNI
jgi:hypothetical protein